jgi:folate-dependent phosphoribosylglycinamide formyltransferase PurN
MDFQYEGCTVHVTAGIDHGAIVAHARIELGPGAVGASGDTHEMEFHRDFVDEHEAVQFAQERAIAWVDEHVEPPASPGPNGAR